MVTEGLVGALTAVCGFLLSLLPTDTVDWPDVSGFPAFLGQHAGPFNTLLPLSEAGYSLELVVEFVMPIVIGVRLSTWLWGLLPGT